MELIELTWKEYEALTPEFAKHLEQRGGYTITNYPTIGGTDNAVINIPIKGSLTHWDVNRVGRIVFNHEIDEYEYSPYKPSYDNLLENSKATREAIEEKEREYHDKIVVEEILKKRFKGEGERYEDKYSFTDQHIKGIVNPEEDELTDEEIDSLSFLNLLRYLFFGTRPKETLNKKGNFKVVDFHDEELGKANNLKDAIFIFKQVYKYCRDEDALPFIYEE